VNRKSTIPSDQIEERAFVYSRQGQESVEIGVLIPNNVFSKLNATQIERIVNSFILELAGITTDGQNDSSTHGVN